MEYKKRDIENRHDVEKLIKRFYARVVPDEEIGFFFNEVVEVNWENHLPKMCDFWEDLLFGTTNYKGNPIQVHIGFHKVEPLQKIHFDRWLKLFKETLDENFSGPVTEKALQRATSIATVIQIKTNSCRK